MGNHQYVSPHYILLGFPPSVSNTLRAHKLHARGMEDTIVCLLYFILFLKFHRCISFAFVISPYNDSAFVYLQSLSCEKYQLHFFCIVIKSAIWACAVTFIIHSTSGTVAEHPGSPPFCSFHHNSNEIVNVPRMLGPWGSEFSPYGRKPDSHIPSFTSFTMLGSHVCEIRVISIKKCQGKQLNCWVMTFPPFSN